MNIEIKSAYFVCMPKPCSALLLTANKCNPVSAATAQSFPEVKIALSPPSFLRALESGARCGTHTMSE